jgi:hypothetical protein
MSWRLRIVFWRRKRARLTAGDNLAQATTGLFSPIAGCINPWRQVARATKFCTLAPNICGYSVLNLIHVALRAPRIWRWLLDFWKILHPYSRVIFKSAISIPRYRGTIVFAAADRRRQSIVRIPELEDMSGYHSWKICPDTTAGGQKPWWSC